MDFKYTNNDIKPVKFSIIVGHDGADAYGYRKGEFGEYIDEGNVFPPMWFFRKRTAKKYQRRGTHTRHVRRMAGIYRDKSQPLVLRATGVSTQWDSSGTGYENWWMGIYWKGSLIYRLKLTGNQIWKPRKMMKYYSIPSQVLDIIDWRDFVGERLDFVFSYNKPNRNYMYASEPYEDKEGWRCIMCPSGMELVVSDSGKVFVKNIDGTLTSRSDLDLALCATIRVGTHEDQGKFIGFSRGTALVREGDAPQFGELLADVKIKGEDDIEDREYNFPMSFFDYRRFLGREINGIYSDEANHLVLTHRHFADYPLDWNRGQEDWENYWFVMVDYEDAEEILRFNMADEEFWEHDANFPRWKGYSVPASVDFDIPWQDYKDKLIKVEVWKTDTYEL